MKIVCNIDKVLREGDIWAIIKDKSYLKEGASDGGESYGFIGAGNRREEL